MDLARIIISFIFLALSSGAFFISCLQFKGKGYLFNNAYFWADREERQRMDGNPESKKPYCRQSGFAFLFIGILLLLAAAQIAFGWMWLFFAFGVVLLIAIVYAVVSSVKMERQK